MSNEHPSSSQLMIHKASTYFGICLLFFVVVIGLCFFVLKMFPVDKSVERQKVAEFSGTGSATAGKFQVGNEWELRWQHDGHLEGIIWTNAEGEQDLLMEMPGKPIRHQGGVNYFKGGEYTLEIKGTGQWKVEIYQF